jgi:hypothetical protein
MKPKPLGEVRKISPRSTRPPLEEVEEEDASPRRDAHPPCFGFHAIFFFRSSRALVRLSSRTYTVAMSVALPPGIIHHFQSEHNAPAPPVEVVRATAGVTAASFGDASAARAATQSKLARREAQLSAFREQVQQRLRAKPSRSPLSSLESRRADSNVAAPRRNRAAPKMRTSRAKGASVTAAARWSVRKRVMEEGRLQAQATRSAKEAAQRKRATAKRAQVAAQRAKAEAIAAREEATRREHAAEEVAAAAEAQLAISLRRGGGRNAPVGTPSAASRSTSRTTAIKARRSPPAANVAVGGAPLPRSSPPPPPTPTQSAEMAAALRTAKREAAKQRSAARFVEGLRQQLLQRVGKTRFESIAQQLVPGPLAVAVGPEPWERCATNCRFYRDAAAYGEALADVFHGIELELPVKKRSLAF